MPAGCDLGLAGDEPEEIDEYSLARVFDARQWHRHAVRSAPARTSGCRRTALREALRAVQVVLDAMQTGPAIRTYNIMLGERRRVAAALIAVP